MQQGLIHIYEGNGKGKTTAGVGLALRCAGHGFPVVYSQFLKDGSSGEIGLLRQIPQITVMVNEKSFGFTFRMNEEQKKEATGSYETLLESVIRQTVSGGCRLLVLDEVLDACNCGMVSTERLVDFLKQKPEELEVVMTGRNPAQELVELADYITYMKKIKHPFDRGIYAREGIEH